MRGGLRAEEYRRKLIRTVGASSFSGLSGDRDQIQ